MDRFKENRPPEITIPRSEAIPIIAPKPKTPDTPILYCLACNKYIFQSYREEHNKSEIHKYFEGLKEKASK